MNIFKIMLITSFIGSTSLSFAQEKDTVPPNWYNLDYKTNGVMGISTEKAYQTLLKNKTATPVIVAVLDGGIDPNHEDLKNIMWINTRDSSKNGIDNDQNGYINDRYGWNFIGNKNGENVAFDNLEVTRLLRDLDQKYLSVLPSTPMNETERRAFIAYQKMVTDYASKLDEAQRRQFNYNIIKKSVDGMIAHAGKDTLQIKFEDLENLKSNTSTDKLVLKTIQSSVKKDGFKKFYDDLNDAVKYIDHQIKYHLNKNYDSRSIVGDNYQDAQEHFYGNNDVKGPDALHGTHVAGIIGAERNNHTGINGVADNIKIMAVRIVPDGDERDKDVANGIRYAVDNGAKIINMSFGKSYKFDKKAVDEAVKYAQSKDVLLVHAAGNDAQNNDISPNYPTKNFTDSLDSVSGTAENWITVGASGIKRNSDLLADFSNYGKKTVDVFAPGVKIYSTIPDNKYKEEEGTSMASPVVAGLAAIIRSYYPQLSAVETKKIIMESVEVPDQNVRVRLENGAKRTLKFSDLSVSGGIVNVYNAVAKANEYLNNKKK